MHIRRANEFDIDIVTDLTQKLYTDSDREELLSENRQLLADENNAVFLAFENSVPAGAAHCSVRHDYVEGTEGGAVGYLEGIYVEPYYRRGGVARELLCHAERWAKGKGCREFASDCPLNNRESQEFHRRVGFAEANIIVCYKKEINI